MMIDIDFGWKTMFADGLLMEMNNSHFTDMRTAEAQHASYRITLL